MEFVGVCCEIHKGYFVLSKLVLKAKINAFCYTKKSILLYKNIVKFT